MDEKKYCEGCGKEIPWYCAPVCSDCAKKNDLQSIRDSFEDGEPDTLSSNYVVCPYCRYAFEPDHNGYDLGDPWAAPLWQEGSHDFECEECGKTFELETSATYWWETSRKE